MARVSEPRSSSSSGKPPSYLAAQASATGRFRLVTDFAPQGDQIQAIDRLVDGLSDKRTDQVLLGVTGSGKTFTIAKVVEKINRPTLVLSHNKTLAAQLYQEFRSFFPENAVEYFVSYYDYYQPEAYVPQTDTYIEKETSRNEEIDKLRLAASKALFERRDVIVVASVSCIYGLGAPDSYYDMLAYLEVGDAQGMPALLARLVEMQYERTNLDLGRGTFRVRGDVLEIQPAYEDTAVRVEFFGDEIEKITKTDPIRGTALQKVDRLALYPRTFYATPRETLDRAIGTIRLELDERMAELTAANRLLEAQRLHQRTMFDLEMIKELGYCNGIENYSRHLSGRAPGEPPPTLLDYFPKDFLLVVDESHVTLPQVRGMYFGDRSRKEVLVEYGFRLPSALDNRPLTYDEFRTRLNQIIAVSATPGPEELQRAGGEIVEQVIRPTGLVDPSIEVRPVKGQVDDLLAVVRAAAAENERVLVTTLTKRMAEELTNYFTEVGVRCRYLHSDIEVLDRVNILADFRRGVFDCLIGINLLREGLDLPEVSVVAILDADKEGFLRSETSLIQTAGRAARNLKGRVLFYADAVTDSMRRAMDETARRRGLQEAYNREHGIVPASIVKQVNSPLVRMGNLDYYEGPALPPRPDLPDAESVHRRIAELEKQMKAAAKELDFEKAASLRDEIRGLRELEIFRS
jgi:excinuclease ABC subunit B